MEKQLSLQKSSLKEKLSFFDYTHICFLFVAKNDKILILNNKTQNKKLSNLGVNISSTKHGADKVVHNFLSYNLSAAEKLLLSKGLNFAVPPSKLNYADYMVSFEKLYRDVKSMDMSSDTKDLIKTRIKVCAI